MIYDFFDHHPKYKPFVRKQFFRSKTTIAIDVKEKSDKIIKLLKSKGLIISPGYGQFNKSQIRIANFPSHSISQMKNLISYFKSA